VHITGASRGIGRATARMLAGEAARVLLVARSADALAGAAAECYDGGGAAEVLALDLTTDGAAERIVAACEQRFGPPGVLVCNAGHNWARPLEDVTESDFDRHWRLNVIAPFHLLRATVPGMAERGGGRVVIVASIAGKRPSLFNIAYSVTKAAQLALSRVWADAFARRGVTVNAVLPGPVQTDLWQGLLEETAAAAGVAVEDVVAGAKAVVPRGDFASKDEIAGVIVFLCSNHAANVAGAAWTVDGGAVQSLL